MRKKLLSVLLTLVMIVSVFGSFSVVASAEEYVAQVIDSNGNATDYPTFEAAWKYAVNYGKTFKLLSDWRVSGNFGANESNKATFFNGGALSVPLGFSVTIDLNGHKICRDKGVNNMTDDGSVIRLFDGASIIIDDNSKNKNGSIEGGSSNYGGGIYAPSNNTVTMNGGRIRLCNGYYGGGVYLDSSSTFIMNGGKIEQNTGYYGGGVYAEDDAVFKTHGGEISGNSATADGGGIYLWSAIAKLNNSVVSANKAKNGGAIYSDYSVVKNYSSLTVDNTKILNNTADNYYGGIYHCAGGFSLLGNTRITGNRNEGKFGGGVYSQKVPIYLAGNVQVYGNYSQGDLPCDVNFGKSLNEAFILNGYMERGAMIGVYKAYGTAPVYWCRSYHLQNNCTDTDNNMKSLADCLFLNESGANGFSYSEKTDSHSQDRTWHDTWIDRKSSTVKSDVKVTKVYYRGVLLSPSEYSSDYNAGSRTITLNVPDYVTDTNRLTVYANIKNSDNQWDSGKEIRFSDGFDISEKQALIVNTVNKSPDYTVTVDGGTVDGNMSALKKYFEPFSIAPTVPEGKVFSHWEIEGDNADDITGFKKYAKSPAGMEMPKHNVTFKAVFAEEVSSAYITLTKPEAATASDSCSTAVVEYKAADGTVKKTENAKVRWRKSSVYDNIKEFDYNTEYTAAFSFGDNADSDFGFANAKKFEVFLNDVKLLNDEYTYCNKLETGVIVSGTAPDAFAIKQRIINVAYKHKTAKAKVLSVESPTIEIPSGISIEELNKLLPDSVNITYESIDGNKTASAPVLWDTASLTGTVQDNPKINGTVTIPETLEATEEQKRTTITVTISGKTRLKMPSAKKEDGTTIENGGTIALKEKIILSAEDGATIWYKIDDGAFTQYNANTGIDPQGEAGEIVERKITAYCTKEGFFQSEFFTLNVKVDNQSVYTVKIVDKNGIIYGYASGAGEYKIGDSVTVKATEDDPEKFVLSWSSEGITLAEPDKTAPEFTFKMPAEDVTITAESFRYYVSKLYLSSITPIADNPLPQTLEIIGAEDVNGNAFDKNDILLKVMLVQWQKYNEDTGKYEQIDSSSISEKGEKYLAGFSVEPNSGVKASCDNLEIFIDDEKITPFGYQGHYIIGWDFTAVYDELKSVNLGDSITAYTGNYVEFPEKIGVKTKYDSITTADVTWTGTDSINTSTPAGNYPVTATLTLPDNVTATDAQKNRTVTVKVRNLVNSVALETVGGNAPAKSGETLPTSLNVKSAGARLAENSFSVLPNNNVAVSGTEYTIIAKVAPAENCEFAANTIFTINGISMKASPAENGEYELTYTFTAEEVQSYDVIVNGGTSQKYKEGDTVNISTQSSGFYKWTAEVVYETTETMIGEDGKPVVDENGNAITETVTHRNPVNIFTDGNEYKAETSFVMPKLADGRRLELTANKAHGIIAYDKQTMTADIVADKAYNGKTVIFAAYSDGKLVSVEYVNKNLTEGFNAVTAPEAFSITGADTIKVMVWDGFDSIKPLFEAYEESVDRFLKAEN